MKSPNLESLADLILGEEHLYHVADSGAIPGILRTGLEPNPEAFRIQYEMEGLKKPAVFLCTAKALAGFKEMKRNPTVQCSVETRVLSVDAVEVSRMEIALDFTHGQVKLMLAEGCPISEVLDACGSVVCFETIPPHLLRLVD